MKEDANEKGRLYNLPFVFLFRFPVPLWQRDAERPVDEHRHLLPGHLVRRVVAQRIRRTARGDAIVVKLLDERRQVLQPGIMLLFLWMILLFRLQTVLSEAKIAIRKIKVDKLHALAIPIAVYAWKCWETNVNKP